MEKINEKLRKNGTKPRAILNTLNLVEFLLKNGSSKFKAEIEDELFIIKKFKNYLEDDEEDLNTSIQTISQRILALMDDLEELKRAREEAQKLKERIRGFSSEIEAKIGSYDEDPRYGGMSSDKLASGQYNTSGNPEVNLARRLGLQTETTNNDVPKTTHTDKNESRTENSNDSKPKVSPKQTDEEDFLGLGTEKKNSKVNDDDDFLGLNSQNNKKNDQANDLLNLTQATDKLDLLTGGQEKPKKATKLLPPPPKKKVGTSTQINSTQNITDNNELLSVPVEIKAQVVNELEQKKVEQPPQDPHDLILF